MIEPLSSPPKNLNLAIVGVGYWGKNLVRTFREFEDIDISILCDRNVAELKEFSPTESRIVRDHEIVLADDEVDAVVVSTGISTHYELAKASILAGKHVFVEKPMAVCPDEVEELRSLAFRRNLVLFVDYLLLYNPLSDRVREIIKDRELGELLSVQMNRLHPPRDGSFEDVVIDLLPHDFSLMWHLFSGFPFEVLTLGKSEECGTAKLQFRYPSGLVVNTHLSRTHFEKQRVCEINGQASSLVWDDQLGEVSVSADSDGPRLRLAADAPLPLSVACRTFIDSVRMGASPDHQLSVMLARAYRAIEASRLNGQWVQI